MSIRIWRLLMAQAAMEEHTRPVNFEKPGMQLAIEYLFAQQKKLAD
jgi:hypothetical protein